MITSWTRIAPVSELRASTTGLEIFTNSSLPDGKPVSICGGSTRQTIAGSGSGRDGWQDSVQRTTFMDEKQFPTFEQLHPALGPDMMSWMHDMVSRDKPPVGGRSVGAKPKKGKKRIPISFASPSQSVTPFSPSENAPEAQGDLQPQSSPELASRPSFPDCHG